MNGNVNPIKMHQGSIEMAKIKPEKNRYVAEFISPMLRRFCSPKEKSCGTIRGLKPINNSVNAYKKSGEKFDFLWTASIHLPPNHDPNESPNIKTEMTTDKTGVITPKVA